jgi:hypothetical protein
MINLGNYIKINIFNYCRNAVKFYRNYMTHNRHSKIRKYNKRTYNLKLNKNNT